MLHNEIERIWKNSPKTEGVNFNKSELFTDLNSQLNRFDNVLKKRDLREIFAAALVILLFGTGAFYFTDPLSKAGMILGVLYGILVIGIIRNAKKHKPASYGSSTKEYLIKYQQYLVKQKSLLRNIIYWYLLPPFVCCLLFFIGQDIGTTMLIINTLIVLSIYIFIFFLNKSGVKKNFDPLIEKLDKTIIDLTSKEELF